MHENGSMPPPGLSAEDLEKWWNGTLKKEGLGGKIETLSDWERECPFCKTINPCTGDDTCMQCKRDITDAKRLPKSNRFNPGRY